ncbi:MAG: hypothetical protein LBN27_02750 [Prevotellaceae bacterium]|jgi:hypothetical protein|nr:hypothetical protein [Prevotellaceae bacterium]
METTKKQPKRQTAISKSINLSARDRIKPRGLFGLYKGRIHWDKEKEIEIFNLGPL